MVRCCLSGILQDPAGGRRRKLRMLAQVVDSAGRNVPGMSAISEEFAVSPLAIAYFLSRLVTCLADLGAA